MKIVDIMKISLLNVVSHVHAIIIVQVGWIGVMYSIVSKPEGSKVLLTESMFYWPRSQAFYVVTNVLGW